eukprot:TRINITY_DN6748_c0_g1_i1.p1 TRINITY_DN6748_c0_g1~~TRINITY_DN6748_c0_g1_i1.p1  ORF type:complete len:616 (-),score=150.65 TRINITY_DN6748_c0_g1_i1:53-1900(-)
MLSPPSPVINSATNGAAPLVPLQLQQQQQLQGGGLLGAIRSTRLWVLALSVIGGFMFGVMVGFTLSSGSTDVSYGWNFPASNLAVRQNDSSSLDSANVINCGITKTVFIREPAANCSTPTIPPPPAVTCPPSVSSNCSKDIDDLRQKLVQLQTAMAKKHKYQTEKCLCEDAMPDYRSNLLKGNHFTRINRIERQDVVQLLRDVVPVDLVPGPPTGLLLTQAKSKDPPSVVANSTLNTVSLAEEAHRCEELVVAVVSRRHCLVVLEASHHVMPFHLYRFKQSEVDADLKNERHASVDNWNLIPRVEIWARKLPDRHRSAEGDEMVADFYSHLAEMTNELRPKLEKIAKNNNVIVMCINEGNLDLVLNFIKSAWIHNIDVSNLIVFGPPQVVDVLSRVNVSSYFHSGFGTFPNDAAIVYGDAVFRRMMWFKISPLYIVQRLGYNVLFQDADVVWFKDPFPYLKRISANTIWMDDGARSERFSPVFVNSGFYFLRNNPNSLLLLQDLIASLPLLTSIGSHQEILSQILADHISRFATSVHLLPLEEFPSGMVYHHRKDLLKQMKDKQVIPYVFHMCWTSGKKDKLKYMKELGWWYLPDQCTVQYLISNKTAAFQCLSY